MATPAFGQYFDNPDDIYNWYGDAVVAGPVINVLSRSGVLDALVKGPATIEKLAGVSGIPAPQLQRLVNFLVGHEVIDCDDDGTIRASQRTLNLHEAACYFQCCEMGSMAGSRLLPALRQGDVTPFELYFGEPVFEYFNTHPERAAPFGQMMGWMTRRVERFLFSQHRFEPFETVADIGGSMGDLVLAILVEYPGTKGILFDLPATVDMARPNVAASPHAERVDIIGGSFFESVPSADLYTLKQILHDWHDDECVQILSNIRKAINPGGRLAVIDHVLSVPPTAEEALNTDIAMMEWDTGRERHLADFEHLFAATGFHLARLTRNPSGHSVIEAVPV
jgi:SAM-dependent methyltransferase